MKRRNLNKTNWQENIVHWFFHYIPAFFILIWICSNENNKTDINKNQTIGTGGVQTKRRVINNISLTSETINSPPVSSF
jgi:hypothetical protein